MDGHRSKAARVADFGGYEQCRLKPNRDCERSCAKGPKHPLWTDVGPVERMSAETVRKRQNQKAKSWIRRGPDRKPRLALVCRGGVGNVLTSLARPSTDEHAAEAKTEGRSEHCRRQHLAGRGNAGAVRQENRRIRHG